MPNILRSDSGECYNGKFKTIGEQIRILKMTFPDWLTGAKEASLVGDLPLEAEGWFVATHFLAIGPDYKTATNQVLKILAGKVPNVNFETGLNISDRVHYLDRTMELNVFITNTMHAQGNEPLSVFPIKFELLRQVTFTQALEEVKNKSEIPFGLFEICLLLQALPKIIQSLFGRHRALLCADRVIKDMKHASAPVIRLGPAVAYTLDLVPLDEKLDYIVPVVVRT